MFNITNHQGNANQNLNEIPPHTCQNGYYQKENNTDKKKTSVLKNVEKKEHLCTVGGNVIGTITMENSMEIAPTLKNRTTIWYSNSTSKYLYEENKNTNLKRHMHSMFIAALFTIAKIWKQLKCPLTNEWIKKVWCRYTIYITQP